MKSYKLKEDLLARITVNPKVLVGKPTIRGLRISVEQILRALANNITLEELLDDYPELEFEDIQAVLMYATELVAEQKVFQDVSLDLIFNGHDRFSPTAPHPTMRPYCTTKCPYLQFTAPRDSNLFLTIYSQKSYFCPL